MFTKFLPKRVATRKREGKPLYPGVKKTRRTTPSAQSPSPSEDAPEDVSTPGPDETMLVKQPDIGFAVVSVAQWHPLCVFPFLPRKLTFADDAHIDSFSSFLVQILSYL